MLTKFPAFLGRAVSSCAAGSALTSCFAVSGVLYIGGHDVLFHDHKAVHTLMFLWLSGMAMTGFISRWTDSREQLICADELCRLLIGTMNDGVWISDGGHRTSFVNRQMADMLGYIPDEMQERSVLEFMFSEDLSKNPPGFLRPRHLREVWATRFRRKDGSELWTCVSSSPLLSKAGECTGTIIIVSDTTLLRNTEETLRRNEKLVAAGRLTATISHEISSPLQCVVNTLRLLRDETMSEQGRHYLSIAEKEIEKVSTIRKRTLDLFRDSSSSEELSLSDLLDETISFCANRLVAQSISVDQDYRSRGTARVSRGGIQQVFANLISNALDAMPSGGTLTLRVTDEESNRVAWVHLEVEDSGAGIADVDLTRIFDPFFTTKKNAGTGLGLWVSKEIVEKHGGTISVMTRTQPGQKCGTRFSILLPRAAAQAVANGPY